MSRLFSRLENRGQDPDDSVAPASPSEADRPTAGQVEPGASAPASPDSKHDLHKDALPAQPPVMQSMVPGYAIASSLGMGVPPTHVVARPVWPVWVWMLSLLLLLGSSLLILALPDRLLPPVQRQPAAIAPPLVKPATPVATATPAVPAPATATPAVPAPGPATIARTDSSAASSPAASAALAPVRTPALPRASRAAPALAATPEAVTPPDPTESAACSEAMLAMNLCSKSSPQP